MDFEQMGPSILDDLEPPPLTPEELKLAALAAKKLKKQEKALAKKQAAIALAKQQRRDHLQRELNAGTTNMQNLKRVHRRLLRQITLREMQQELESTWHTFERLVDLKDLMIERAVVERHESEHQYCVNMHGNVDTIDAILERFGRQLDEERAWYMEQRSELLGRALVARQDIAYRQSEQEEHVLVAGFAAATIAKLAAEQTSGDNIARIDDSLQRNSSTMQTLRANLEHEADELWTTFKKTLADYEQRTAERRRAYQALRVRDVAATEMIHRQMMRINRLHDEARTLRDRLGAVRTMQHAALCDLLSERKFYVDTFCTLRGRLVADREHDRHQLLTLTIKSNAASKWLERLVQKGARVLQLAVVCRKLETQHEKVQPFPGQVTDEESQEDVLQWGEPLKIPSLDINLHQMEQFWRRVAEVDLSRRRIQQYIMPFHMENMCLRHVLGQYLGGQTPIMANSKHTTYPSSEGKGVTTVEAAHIYKYLLP